VRSSGLKVLWTPHITLYHHEAKSRGLDYTSPGKQARYDSEQAVMERRWPDALTSDPSVNPFWHDATLPFHLLHMPSARRVIEHLRATSVDAPWHLN
jgi:O-antigen biosynthesis protein